MPGLDVSPPGMEPLTGPDIVPGIPESVLEGSVYGKAPKPPKDPPNVIELMEAADIPAPSSTGLPHTLEWYRGAKDRKIARAKESQGLLMRKNELRKQWNALILSNLETTGNKVDSVAAEPQPVGDLALLLARTAHERPQHEQRIAELQDRLDVAVKNKESLDSELSLGRTQLSDVEALVRQLESQGDAEEEERWRKKREEDEKRAKNEKILRRNEALLRGEELEDTPRQGEDAPATPGAGTMAAGDGFPGLASTSARSGSSSAGRLPPLRGRPPLPASPPLPT